jgi:hypothetical protein
MPPNEAPQTETWLLGGNFNRRSKCLTCVTLT